MYMYTDDHTMTPRDRISEDMLRRMLDGEYKCNVWDQRTPDYQNEKHAHRETWGLKGYPLASVYAPLQEYRGLFDKETALLKGTLFSELDLPFMGASIANKGGSCRG